MSDPTGSAYGVNGSICRRSACAFARRVCRVNPSGETALLGEFVEVNRPRRIVSTWDWETALFNTPPQSTLVEVSLTPQGEDTSCGSRTGA